MAFDALAGPLTNLFLGTRLRSPAPHHWARAMARTNPFTIDRSTGYWRGQQIGVNLNVFENICRSAAHLAGPNCPAGDWDKVGLRGQSDQLTLTPRLSQCCHPQGARTIRSPRSWDNGAVMAHLTAHAPQHLGNRTTNSDQCQTALALVLSYPIAYSRAQSLSEAAMAVASEDPEELIA